MRRKLSVGLFVAALGCSMAVSGLGVPYRVADLNQERPEFNDEIGFVDELSGRAIVLTWGSRFNGDGGVPSQGELWASSLTSGEAEPIASFDLGYSYPHPQVLGKVQGRLLFRIDGYAPVWTTDGTQAGTMLLSPGSESPYDNAFDGSINVGDHMLFSDSQGMAWSTDGTPVGTEPLGFPFPFQIFPGGDRRLPTLGSHAYFLAGRQVVGTDGTVAGTSILTEFHDGSLDGLIATADRLYFVRYTQHAQELWMSDGSPGGTRRVRRFGPAFGGTRIEPPMSLLHGVVFLECQIAATLCHLSREGVTGSPGSSRLTPDRLVQGAFVLHGRAKNLVFADGDGQIWGTDGTPQGTSVLRRCTGRCRARDFGPFPIKRSGGRSLFTILDNTGYAAQQVWVTDGTKAGTRPLDAGCARKPGCGTRFVAVNGDVALLELTETDPPQRRVARLDIPSVRSVASLGLGVALADGDGFLVAGDRLTRLAADGTVVASLSFPGHRNGDAIPRSLIALGDRLVFTACGGERQRIYWTDGAPGSIVPLTDGTTSCLGYDKLVPPVSFGGAVFFDTQTSVVRIDAAGHALSILNENAAPVPIGDTLALLAPRFECSEDSDGCHSGRSLTTVFVSPDGSGPPNAVATLPISPYYDRLVSGDRLLITDRATTEGLFAFRPSQADAGLEPIHCQPNGDVCPQGKLARLGDTVFLLAEGLWRIEGNAATHIAPPAGAAEFSHSSGLVESGGALYFFAQPQDQERMWLYRSDGSEAGTVTLAPIENLYERIDFQPLSFNGKLYFTVATEELGEEIWVSDGTAAGTHPFLDLRQGAESSHPLLLSVAAGRLFFSANDGEHGIELWSTDGTAEHTAMVADIAPGPLSSLPGRPVLAGTTLYFAAEDGATGNELWALPMAP